jgi:hypothetical protein
MMPEQFIEVRLRVIIVPGMQVLIWLVSVKQNLQSASEVIVRTTILDANRFSSVLLWIVGDRDLWLQDIIE